MVSCRQSGRLLECIEDNFLGQVTHSPATGDAVLDQMGTNASELIHDIEAVDLEAVWAAVIMCWWSLQGFGSGKE